MVENATDVLTQYQSYQQQLQAVLVEKETLRLQVIEVESAIAEIENAKGEAYKIVGPIMVKKPVEEIKKELKEKKEKLNLRLTTLQRAEERLVQKLKDLQPKVESILKSSGILKE